MNKKPNFLGSGLIICHLIMRRQGTMSTILAYVELALTAGTQQIITVSLLLKHSIIYVCNPMSTMHSESTDPGAQTSEIITPILPAVRREVNLTEETWVDKSLVC